MKSCPRCSSELKVETGSVYLSNPPKYAAYCTGRKCDYRTYVMCSEVDNHSSLNERFSLRDHFAGLAMAANADCEGVPYVDTARDAYCLADAMLAERERRSESIDTQDPTDA